MAQSGTVTHRTNQHFEIQPGIFTPQFLLQIIGVIFINIKYHQFARTENSNLTAQFAANGTAAPRYQYRFIVQVTTDFLCIQAYFITSKQIHNIHIANDDVFVAFQNFVQSRYRFQLTPSTGTNIDDGPLVRIACRGNGQQDLVYVVPRSHTGNTISVAHYFHAVNASAFFAAVIINGANGNLYAFRSAFHFFNDHGAHFPGPHNHHALNPFPFALQVPAADPANHAIAHPSGANQHER